MSKIKGCDISKHQGVVDFNILRNNLEFVIIRASYGNGYKDSQYDRNRDEVRKAELLCGWYHYAYPQYNTPQAEADWFTKTISCQPGELMVLDFEENYSDPVNWCKAFLDRCTSNMGFKPLLYINLALNNQYDWKPVIDAGYGLWLARWDYNPDADPPTTDWPVVAMRQYSNNGNIGGITPLDLNVFYGTQTQFKKYGNPAPPIPEPIPPSLPSSSVSPSQPESQPTPIPADPCEAVKVEKDFYKSKVESAKAVLNGKGWWWTKYFQLKQILLS